jgi:hypothetical protein
MSIHDWHFLLVVVLIVAAFAGFYLADVIHDRWAWRRATKQARGDHVVYLDPSVTIAFHEYVERTARRFTGVTVEGDEQ